MAYFFSFLGFWAPIILPLACAFSQGLLNGLVVLAYRKGARPQSHPSKASRERGDVSLHSRDPGSDLRVGPKWRFVIYSVYTPSNQAALPPCPLEGPRVRLQGSDSTAPDRWSYGPLVGARIFCRGI